MFETISSTIAPLFAANAMSGPFSETPFDSGAIFIYALMTVLIFMVLYFGLKKGKGPDV